ncbi:DUF6541 family protein [uncultured Mobiluncus sp.]|uniref:DUF6541 family protein n=1 Tax=uncultured Mobiluncus sp. TaxID=293425 RepID=UPI00263A365E|nr:DUF6541 family protein [uncultured Mobiluncus sp.]
MTAFLLCIAVLAVFLILPGFLLALAARFRLLPALALGAPITAGILAVFGQVLAWLHIPWNLQVVGPFLVFLVAAVCFKRMYSLRHQPRGGHAMIAQMPARPVSSDAAVSRVWFVISLVLALVVAGIIQLLPLVQTLPMPASPSQSFDAMFHYSSVRVVAEDGSAAWKGALDSLYPGRQGVYYPAQWATLLSLFVPYATPTFLSNALLMALTLTVWPLGVALLAQYAFGQRHPSVPLAVLLSPWPLVFPYYLGVLQSLYPYILAVMWWPLALWVILRSADTLASWHAGEAPDVTFSRLWERFFPKTVLGVLVVFAAVHAHPSIFGFLCLAVFACLLNAVVKRQLKPWWWVGVVLAALAGGLVVPLGLAWLGIGARATQAGDNLETLRALAAMLGLSQIYQDPWWLPLPLGLLSLLGLVWYTTKCRDLRLVTIIAGILVLVAATKVSLGPLSILTGLWYGAYDRIGSGIAVFLPVFAAGAVGELAVMLSRAVPSRAVPVRVGVASLTMVLLTGVVATPIAPRCYPDRVTLATIAFVPGSQFHAPWVSSEEFAAMSSLQLTRNSLVIGDPSAGEGLLYAVTGIPTYYLQLSGSAFDENRKYLAEHFREIGTNPKVCAIIRAERITHYYADATGVSDGDFTYPGLHNVDVTRGFTPVAQLGEATVYKIEACGANSATMK